LAPFARPFTEIAANIAGSLKTSGRFLTETWDSAPVPSKQTIPAPIPPIGKAMRSRNAPPYGPLNGRALTSSGIFPARNSWVPYAALESSAHPARSGVRVNPEPPSAAAFKKVRRVWVGFGSSIFSVRVTMP